MARARGANAVMALAFASSYGAVPASGYRKLPFSAEDLGETQGLVASDLLGYGRDPQRPSRDVVNNDAPGTVVPLDLRNFGYWLKLACGAPTTTQGVSATGSYTFSAQPANNSIITVGGQAITFVTGTPTANQVKIGATLADTIANAVRALNASAVAGILVATYTADLAGTKINITYDTVGTGGNAMTIVAGSSPATNATASGATLAGGVATGPYNHVFVTGAAALPDAAIEIGNPEVPSYEMSFGVMLDEMAIALQRSGHLNARLKLIGQGSNAPAASTGAGTPAEQVIERFSQFSGQIWREGVPLAEVVSGEFTLANGLDKVETIRADGRIGGCDAGMLAVMGKIGARFATTELLDLAVAGTATEILLSWSIGSGKSLSIMTHYVDLPKPKKPVTGPGGIQSDFDWIGSEHPTLGKTCTITLVNDVSAY